MHRFVLGAASLILATTAAFAQQPRFVTLTLDNDWFAHQDRHYTGGLQAAFGVRIDDLPGGVRALVPSRWSSDRMLVLAIGQRIYTPENVNPKPGEPPDRPYAGWLYFQADFRTAVGPVVDHVIVDAGYIGPGAGARQMQQFAHHLFHSDELPGWSQQLKSEPTLSVGFERTWMGLVAQSRGAFTFDVSPYAGATVGTPYTYAHAGVVARFGRNLPPDVPAAQITLGPPRDGYRGTQAFGWYVWAGADGRGVARNVFLDGSTFRDSPGVDRKPWQHDWQVGIVAAWPRARAGLTMVQRSREFDGQRSPDRFGQLSVAFAY
jgi:hypothetical protein